MAIGAFAIYAGPISVYYGDKSGDQNKNCNGSTYGNNCARTYGHILGFNGRQQDLHDFTKKLMQARLSHPAMYRGTHGRTFQKNTYFNCKYDEQTGDKVVYVTTMNWDPTTVTYTVGGNTAPNAGAKINAALVDSTEAEDAGKKKSSSATVIAISFCACFVAVIVAVTIYYWRKSEKSNSTVDDQYPLLQEENSYTDLDMK